MPDTGAPWNIPYVAGTDLVADWPTDSQTLATAIADGLSASSLIKQVVQTVKTDTFTTTSTSFVPVTGMEVTITPTSATSKVLVIATMNVSVNAGGYYSATTLKRDATDILLGDAASSRTRATTAASEGSGGMTFVQTITYLDSPATTSATDYSLEIAILNGSGQIVAVNRTVTDSNTAFFHRTASTITAIEVGA